MKRMSWKDIRARLAAGDVSPAVPDATDFWAEFRERSRLRRQERSDPALLSAMPVGWALAAAAALLLLAALLPSVRAPAAPASEFNRIESLEVQASHGAVLMIDDEEFKSTLVWIVDMEQDDEEEGDQA